MSYTIHLDDNKKNIPAGSHVIVLVYEGYTKAHLPQQFIKYEPVLVKEKFTGGLGKSMIFNDGEHYITFLGAGKKEEFLFPKLHKSLGETVRTNMKSCNKLFINATSLAEEEGSHATAYELAMMADLASYTFDKYKSSKEPKKKREVTILLPQVGDEEHEAAQEALAIAEGIKFTRDIVNEPSNVATPQYLAYLMKADEKETGFTTEIFEHKKILEMGMNLVDAVGRGSVNPPHFTKITYKGNPNSSAFIALVGKGVSFDCGGVQVKPDFSMNSMKGDMGGAGLVMGVMHVIAKLKLPVNVIAYMPFVQNVLDGRSYNPDDVYTAFNGKTVEIIHTDAEGRLILADALSYASNENPTEIFDFATLTGAATVALGNRYAAIMGTNDDAKQVLYELGQHVGEKVWELPLDDDYREYLNSDIADIANCPTTRMQPGTITGGLFLKEFVSENIPWVHMDIAAVATASKPKDLHSHFATGFGVRLMVEYLKLKATS